MLSLVYTLYMLYSKPKCCISLLVLNCLISDEVEESYEQLYSSLISDWMLLEIKHRISLTASNEMWKLANQLIPKLIDAKKKEKITRKIPQFRSIRDSLYKTHVPKISMEIGYEVKETGDIIILKDIEAMPVGRFPPSRFIKLYEAASIKV